MGKAQVAKGTLFVTGLKAEVGFKQVVNMMVSHARNNQDKKRNPTVEIQMTVPN